MRPYNIISGDQFATMLGVFGDDLAVLVSEGTVPAPDAGVCHSQWIWTWGWNTATVATAMQSLTQATVKQALLLARADPNFKPYRPAPNSAWAF